MNERNDGGIRCSQVLAHLSDYIDGELDEPTTQKIELHLATCANCERFGRNFGQMVISVRSLKDDHVEQRLLDSIREAIDGAHQQ